MKVFLKKRILTWFFQKLLSKKCNSTIPRSGESASKVDCFTIHLLNNRKELTHVVVGINKNEVYTRVINQQSNNFSINETMNLDDISPNLLCVTHYYGLFEITYIGINDFIFSFFTKHAVIRCRWKLFSNHIAQSYFNRKELIAKTSIEILNAILETQVDSGSKNIEPWMSYSSDGIDIYFLMTKLFTIKWIDHPNSTALLEKIAFHLQSLVELEDLKKENDKYSITPKGLKTIEEYEIEERRHKDQKRNQTILTWLTFIVMIATVVQAISALIQTKIIDISN